MENNRAYAKQLGLLFAGALISTFSALVTSYIGDKRSDIRESKTQKVELNIQISKDIGQRYYSIYNFYRAKRDKDSLELKIAYSKYKDSKEEWNMMIDLYRSYLSSYYGAEIAQEFEKQVYVPMLTLSRLAERREVDRSVEKLYKGYRKHSSDFIQKINLLVNIH